MRGKAIAKRSQNDPLSYSLESSPTQASKTVICSSSPTCNPLSEESMLAQTGVTAEVWQDIRAYVISPAFGVTWFNSSVSDRGSVYVSSYLLFSQQTDGTIP